MRKPEKKQLLRW